MTFDLINYGLLCWSKVMKLFMSRGEPATKWPLPYIVVLLSIPLPPLIPSPLPALCGHCGSGICVVWLPSSGCWVVHLVGRVGDHGGHTGYSVFALLLKLLLSYLHFPVSERVSPTLHLPPTNDASSPHRCRFIFCTSRRLYRRTSHYHPTEVRESAVEGTYLTVVCVHVCICRKQWMRSLR